MSRLFSYLCLLLTLLLIPALSFASTEERGVKINKKETDRRRRIALVIGNSSYSASPLKNPTNDAWAMAAALRKLGFDVQERTNLGYAQMHQAIDEFGKKLQQGGVGLFYYAGHGIQYEGSNYLIPAGTDLADEAEVRYKAIDAGLVLAKMERAKSDINIMILDACRNNPFASAFRSVNRGLANMDAPTGSLIAYSTAPGKTALDGTGANGLYTEELIKVLQTPDITVEQAFKRVRKAVLDRTAGAQVPWESSSLVGDFYFALGENDQAASTVVPTTSSSEPTQVFAVNVDTIVEKGGFIWWRDAFYKGKKMDVREALSVISSMNVEAPDRCRNWRLPNVADFVRLAKHAESSGYKGKGETIEYLKKVGFLNVRPEYYWTSQYVYPHTNFLPSKAVDMETGADWDKPNYEPLIVWPVCDTAN